MKPQNTPQQSQTAGTVFNSSLSCLERLDEKLRECGVYSIICSAQANPLMLNLWHKTLLLAVSQEVIPNIDKEQSLKTKIDEIKKLLKEYYEVGSVYITKKKFLIYNTESYTIINKKNYDKKIMINYQLEQKLRIIATKLGMLLTKKELEDVDTEYW